MLHNPGSLLFYFFIYGVIASTLTTISDESFTYGFLPDFYKEISSSTKELPWSLWNIVTALSDVIEEIVRNFSFYVFLFILPIVLFVAYRDARGKLNGIKTERKVWLDWYEREKIVDKEDALNTLPPTSQGTLIESYFKTAVETVIMILRTPLLLLIHFGYFISVLSLFIITIQSLIYDSLIYGVLATIPFYVNELPQHALWCGIFAIVSTFRENRGKLRGIAAERLLWTRWYFSQIEITSDGGTVKEAPKSGKINVGSYLNTLIDTAILMFRQPTSLILYYILLLISCQFIYSFSLGYWITLKPNRIIPLLIEYGVSSLILAIIILYRKTRGTQKGIVKEQQFWMKLYIRHLVKKTPEDTFDIKPPLNDRPADSFFITAKETVLTLLREPQRIVSHFFGWITALLLLYGITDWLLFERLDDFVQIFFVIVLAISTSYLETRETIYGMTKEGRIWSDWFRRRQETKSRGLTFTELPPSLK